MTSVQQGRDLALVFEFAGTVTGPEITITLDGGAVAVGPTSVGLADGGGGRYTYVWSVPDAQAPGSYTATVDGTIAGNPVEESVAFTVTGTFLYADLATLKAAIKETNTDRDDLLTQALSSASRGIDRMCGRHFYADESASARVFNPRRRIVAERDGQKLLVDDISSLTGLVVEIGSAGGTYSAVTDYETGPENALARSTPITTLLRYGSLWAASTLARVRVTALWGWPDVPDQIVQATLIQAGRLYKRKDSPEGVLGSAEWGTVRLSRVDPDVRALVQPFVLPGFG